MYEVLLALIALLAVYDASRIGRLGVELALLAGERLAPYVIKEI